jgi:hypothetical protein
VDGIVGVLTEVRGGGFVEIVTVDVHNVLPRLHFNT